MSVLPNNTFISPYNSFFGSNSGNVILPSTINANTLNASTINAPLGNISTVNTSTINVIQIDLDGQILTADANDLLLNGIPIATTSQLSNIADWSLYEAISTVRMNNENLSNVNNVYFQVGATDSILQLQANTAGTVLSVNGQPLTAGNAGNAANWSQYPAGQDVNIAQYNLTNVKNISSTGINGATQLNINNTGGTAKLTTDITGTNLYVNGAVVATGGSASNWSQFPANTNVDMSYNALLNTRSINLVSSSTAGGNGTLTVNETGTEIFFNGNQLAQQAQISSVADWSLYPTISTVQIFNPIKAPSGRLQLYGEGIDMGSLGNLPSGSTNTMVIRSGDINIASDGGGGFNVATGLSLAAGAGFSLAGGAAGSITTGLLLLIQAGGALALSAAGAVTIQAVGACSMAATGPINIGSADYTSLETIRIDNSLITRDTSTSDRLRIRDVQEIQGNNTGGGGSGRLDILGDGVAIQISSSQGVTINGINNAGVANPIKIATNGVTGTGINTVFYSMEQDFDPNSQSMNYNIGTTNLSNLFPPFTNNRISKVSNPLNGSTISHILSETYDGNNTITYANTQGAVNITGITTLRSDTINATTVNATTLNIPNLTTSSINVSSITANYASFSTLLTSASTIRLGGNFPGVNFPLGNNSVGLGYASQPLGSNSVAIGLNAGNEGGSYSVNIGSEAGTLSGSYNVNLGYKANFLGGESNIVINATSTVLTATANSATFIKPLRNVSTQPGGTTFAMGYTNATGECVATNTKVAEIESTIQNTQRIVYSEGLLTTTIDGILAVNGNAEFTQNVNMDTTLNVLQTLTASTITSGSLTISHLTNLSSLGLNGISLLSAPNALFYNSTTTQVSYAPITTIIAQPAFVYYVATNGRAGASGAITDPLSTINEALAKLASTGGGRPGMTIYIAPGAYLEDVVINISATLPAVSVIGMADDDVSSKRVQITGSFTINGTDATFTNTIDTVVINNILVNAKNATTSAVTITGAGIRVYLKNGLYTNANVATVPLISLSSTGVLPTTVAQLAIDDCSITMDSATASGHLISVASGQIFNIGYSDLTHKGTGSAIVVTGGTFSSANNSSFNSKGNVLNLAFSVAGLISLTNCLVSGSASPTVALIQCGTNANLNLTDSTVQNVNTTEANNTSRYVYLVAGVLVSAIRNNFSSSASPAITQMTPFQSTTPASSILFYIVNIYTNASNSVKPILPTWALVQQYNNDIVQPTPYVPLSVLRTSPGTTIALTSASRGNTYILTSAAGGATQAFSQTGLVAGDAGFYVNVKNGNGTNGGDITITGATGNTVVHNQTLIQNGQTVVLYWNGSAFVAY